MKLIFKIFGSIIMAIISFFVLFVGALLSMAYDRRR